MAFPQPTADTAVQSGLDFFRLNTPLASPGDLYESTQSCHAFAIGPDSDIANVLVTYYDEQGGDENPNGDPKTNSLILSPDRSFIGRLDAFNPDGTGKGAVQYPLAKRAGRILITSADIYDPNYRPRAANLEDDHFSYPPPVLDVIQYFGEAPSLVPQRSDKAIDWRFYDTINNAVQWLIVPYYGRKYAYLTIQNFNAIEDIDVQIIGVNLTITANGQDHIETQLMPSTVVAAAAAAPPVTFRVRAAVNGMFDLLVIGVGATDSSIGPAPMTLVISDDPL